MSTQSQEESKRRQISTFVDIDICWYLFAISILPGFVCFLCGLFDWFLMELNIQPMKRDSVFDICRLSILPPSIYPSVTNVVALVLVLVLVLVLALVLGLGFALVLGLGFALVLGLGFALVLV